jgi:TRAP-type C4-dicarboxylate transport system permease large subunit
LVQWITGQALEPWVVVAAMMALLIFLGVFVDQVSMMMITLPIFMPVVTSLNIDLVWFGVMFLICMQLGMLLPPHGMLLMTMKGVAPPEVTMGHIFKAVTPYVIMSIVLLVLVFCVPTVAVWLPNLMD